MDTSEATAKLVNTTYRNVIEELGPCIKHLVVVGRTYLKSLHGMVAAGKNYNDALSKVATLADNSTLRGSSDIGAALHHLVDINKEMQAQLLNILKSLEFDFLEAMEIAADKDTKLVGREQKRFQQMHKGRKEAFEKTISTLKKSRRKKSINTDKQLAQMKLMENSKTRLEEFCDESLKEAVVQERLMYGIVLERQCAFNKQLLIYHSKGCEFLQDNIPHWEALANSRDVIPTNCFPIHLPRQNECDLYTIENAYDQMNLPSEPATLRSTPRGLPRNRDSVMSTTLRLDDTDNRGIYGRPLVKAKSEFNLSSTSSEKPALSSRFSRIVEYNGEASKNYVRAIYPYYANGEYQMVMAEGDIIEFNGSPNATGWQFGENVTSKRCGWFPLSYTEFVENGRSSPASSGGSTVVDDNCDASEKRPLPSPPPQPSMRPVYMNSLVGATNQQPESSEYGTLKKAIPRKLLPVNPPITPELASRGGKENGRASPRRHPDLEESASSGGETRTVYANMQRVLQSVHL